MNGKPISWTKWFSCTNPYMLTVVWPTYRCYILSTYMLLQVCHLLIWVCLFYTGQQLKGRNIRTNWAARKATTPQSKFSLLVCIIIWPVQPCTLFPWKIMRKTFMHEGCMCQSDSIGEMHTALLETYAALWNWWSMTETVLMCVKSDHRSKFSNLSNWKEEAWKKSGLQQLAFVTSVFLLHK